MARLRRQSRYIGRIFRRVARARRQNISLCAFLVNCISRQSRPGKIKYAFELSSWFVPSRSAPLTLFLFPPEKLSARDSTGRIRRRRARQHRFTDVASRPRIFAQSSFRGEVRAMMKGNPRKIKPDITGRRWAGDAVERVRGRERERESTRPRATKSGLYNFVEFVPSGPIFVSRNGGPCHSRPQFQSRRTAPFSPTRPFPAFVAPRGILSRRIGSGRVIAQSATAKQSYPPLHRPFHHPRRCLFIVPYIRLIAAMPFVLQVSLPPAAGSSTARIKRNTYWR